MSGNENGTPTNSKMLSRLVLEAGIEPARPKSLDFESSASTNSATRAFLSEDKGRTVVKNGLQK